VSLDLSHAPALLKPREVAALLRVTPRTVLRYGEDGRLERVRVSQRMIRYAAESVAALLTPTNETRPPVRASASNLAEGTRRATD
jgi:hypothetical protein